MNSEKGTLNVVSNSRDCCKQSKMDFNFLVSDSTTRTELTEDVAKTQVTSGVEKTFRRRAMSGLSTSLSNAMKGPFGLNCLIVSVHVRIHICLCLCLCSYSYYMFMSVLYRPTPYESS